MTVLAGIMDPMARVQKDPASEDIAVMLTNAIVALDAAMDDLGEARLTNEARGLWRARFAKTRASLDQTYRTWTMSRGQLT